VEHNSNTNIKRFTRSFGLLVLSEKAKIMNKNTVQGRRRAGA